MIAFESTMRSKLILGLVIAMLCMIQKHLCCGVYRFITSNYGIFEVDVVLAIIQFNLVTSDMRGLRLGKFQQLDSCHGAS